MRLLPLIPLLFLAAALSQSKVDFAKDVQPVFEKSCYSCHGAKAQLGGLRLDAKSLAMKVIKPGDSGQSMLYQRIIGTGEQARMPMGAKPLDAAQIATIKAWIDQGAEWPESLSTQNAEIKKHWAFLAPKRPPVPVPNAKWARNPIDNFVLAVLEREGLQPSPEAGKIILLRRLSLDLIGLPPTPAEVEAFLRDTTTNAYEKQVERLLSSPHYGERWGRSWLDAARYADSDGFEKDKPRQVWFYRDWVINALNRDMGYDRFITEQLAGDLLPHATQEQRVATGFLRNSMINEEGGIDPEQFRMEAMFDRMEAIGKSVLGLTIQCSQCHNHKYDPFLQEDYYRVFAFFNNSHETNMAVYTSDEERKRKQIFAEIDAVEKDLQRRNPDWQASMAAWEDKVRSDQPKWTSLKADVDDIASGGQKYLLQPDDSLLAAGYAPTKHKAKFTMKTDLTPITGVRLELMNDPNLPLGGPGRSIKGTGALTEIEVEAAPAGEEAKPEKVKIVRATADVNPREKELDAIYRDKSKNRRVTGPIEYAIDGKDTTAWSTDIGPFRRNLPRKAVFVFEKPISHPKGSVLVIHLNQQHGGWNSDDNQNHNLGRFRLSITSDANPVADPLPTQVREALAVPRAQRSIAQAQTVFSFWRTTVPEWSDANSKIEAAWMQHPEGTSQLVLNERSAGRNTHMLSRGDFLKPGKQVQPGTPGFLHSMPAGAPPNRLGFAQWLTDRNSPTTARTIVNRIWQSYFGTGIVATSEDLGRQSEQPSHPELLDWLSVELMERKWSMKQLHRLIVTSATYRQSSNVTKELYDRDPFNRLLARGARIRVEGEIVRDISLAAAGLLNLKVGGPSVYTPAPEFLFLPPSSYGPKIWNEEKGQDRYRRALYTFRYRSVPYPMLQNFDTPNGDMACVRRSRSNTPLQALTTLNEPLFLEAARALALKTAREGGASNEQRLNFAFERCVSRKPDARETAELLSLLQRQIARYADGKSNPWEVAVADPSNPPVLPASITPAQLAGWTAVSRVLLNLDETITRE